MAGSRNTGKAMQQMGAPFVGQGVQPLTGQSYNGPPYGHFADAVPGKVKSNKPLTKFVKARFNLSVETDPAANAYNGIDWYFTSVPEADVIQALGWWNPMLSSRPKPFVQKLLEGIPSPAPGKAFQWKQCGLMYFTPPEIGRLASRGRTTTEGLALLRHWTNRFPKLRPFFDAYWNAEAEEQITLDCVDFKLGLMPLRFQAQVCKNIEKNKKIAEVKRVAAQASAQQAQAFNQYVNANTINSNAQMLSQMQANQMQQAMLQNQLAQQNMQQNTMQKIKERFSF